MPDKAGTDYLWGHSKSEADRIVGQSKVLHAASRRFLEATGLAQGCSTLSDERH